MLKPATKHTFTTKHQNKSDPRIVPSTNFNTTKSKKKNPEPSQIESKKRRISSAGPRAHFPPVRAPQMLRRNWNVVVGGPSHSARVSATSPRLGAPGRRHGVTVNANLREDPVDPCGPRMAHFMIYDGNSTDLSCPFRSSWTWFLCEFVLFLIFVQTFTLFMRRIFCGLPLRIEQVHTRIIHTDEKKKKITKSHFVNR